MKRIGRGEVAKTKCEQIEREERNKGKVAMNFRQKRPTRWRSGTCKLCGRWEPYISIAHMQAHGFKKMDDMLKAGIIRWDDERRE